VKIISWNMGCGFNAGGYRRHHEDALDWLRLQDADVALLQEVQLEKVVSFHGMASHRVPTSPGSPTGNAVLVRAERLDAVNVEIGGALVAGVKARLVGEDFVLVSAHVLTGKHQQEALASFVRCVSRTVVDSRFVVGGDFNASLHWPEYAKWFFEPMRAAGFEDSRPHPQEVQSFWGRGSTAVIQDDHVFVDKVTRVGAGRGSWAIVSSENHRRWSDHGPVVVEVMEYGHS